MKNLILVFFLTLTTFAIGQSWCNPTPTPTLSYQSNLISTHTTALDNWYALCGPNTTVFDTINLHSCHFIYVNSNCSLFFKQYECNTASIIWAKNNSTITILAGSGPINVRREPLAILINQSSNTVDDSLCSSISFPTLNCFTGINETTIQLTIFKTYPNPSSTMINIELISSTNQFADVVITNQLGEVVYQQKQWAITNKRIPIENLSNGSYFIQIKTELGQQTEKLIVLR